MLFERGYENFLYLHHLDLLVWIPTYGSEINVTQNASYSHTKPLGAPNDIYSFAGSGPRTMNRTIEIDRDTIQILNANGLTGDGDPIETLLRALESCCVANYSDARRMINPPIVTYKEAQEITITGVIVGSITTSARGGWINGRKRNYSIQLVITEIEQYDAQSIMQTGHYRGLNNTLMQRIATYGR